MKPGPDKFTEALLEAAVVRLMEDDDYFAGLMTGYSESEITSCKTNFRANRPTVKLGYARSSDKRPVWAILLASKRPQQDFLGRSGGEAYDPDTETQYQRRSTVRTPAIAVWVYTENADVTRWQSDLVEGILTLEVNAILDEFEDVQFGGAQDLAPEEAYAPETVWVRSQTWEFTVFQQYLRPVTQEGGSYVTPPVYVGTEGDDLGDGVKGGVVPFSDRG